MPMITKLAALAVLATLALPARAQTVYVIDQGSNAASLAYQFGTIDLQTGAFHAIATNDRYKDVTALGFGANGKLYALRGDYSSMMGRLDEYSIDTATGEMTLQKEFAHTHFSYAGVNSKGVFTGFLLDIVVGATRLFTLDPVAQSLQVGAFTLVEPTGLVVADGLGNIYASDDQPTEYGGEKLAKVINIHTGAAVLLGNTNLRETHAGFLFHGLLYALNTDNHGRPGILSRTGSNYSRETDIYTLNPKTGTASLVIMSNLPSDFFVRAAALAPDAEAAAKNKAMRGNGDAHR